MLKTLCVADTLNMRLNCSQGVGQLANALSTSLPTDVESSTDSSSVFAFFAGHGFHDSDWQDVIMYAYHMYM